MNSGQMVASVSVMALVSAVAVVLAFGRFPFHPHPSVRSSSELISNKAFSLEQKKRKPSDQRLSSKLSRFSEELAVVVVVVAAAVDLRLVHRPVVSGDRGMMNTLILSVFDLLLRLEVEEVLLLLRLVHRG